MVLPSDLLICFIRSGRSSVQRPLIPKYSRRLFRSFDMGVVLRLMTCMRLYHPIAIRLVEAGVRWSHCCSLHASRLNGSLRAPRAVLFAIRSTQLSLAWLLYVITSDRESAASASSTIDLML